VTISSEKRAKTGVTVFVNEQMPAMERRGIHPHEMKSRFSFSEWNCGRFRLEVSRVVISSVLLLLLTACPKPDDAIKPSVAILQPSNNATLNNAVNVQVDAQDAESGIAKVSVFVRGRGSRQRGVLVGTAVSKPYLVSWQPNAALGVPNDTELELIAVAKDRAGNEETSSPVQVKTQNPGAPRLGLLTAFTYPSSVRTTNASKSLALNTTEIKPPLESAPRMNESSILSSARTLDVANRVFSLEWEWFPVSGAAGYCVYRSDADVAGEYQHLGVCQLASAGAAKERFSADVPNAIPGAPLWGAVTTRSSGNVESGKSNADSATFLPPQDSATPADGSSVTDGKPIFTWTPIQIPPSAATGPNGETLELGYLYYVFDRDPTQAGAVIVGTNFPNAISATSSQWVDFDKQPLPALPSGSYHWWVVGVLFDADGRADALSFSDPKRFVVP
jgi:Bacterial Ig domain